MMLAAGLNGFVLGISLIVAIGAQNAFVLRQGLRREFILAVCLVCAVSDALLIAAGVAGMGTLVRQSPLLLTSATLGGAAFLFFYGLAAFVRAARPRTLTPEGSPGGSLLSTIAICLALTFLNPHVYLDTVVLLGSLSGRYSGGERLAYGAGAAVASFAWFFSLGYGARLLAPVFARAVAWRVLDGAIGVVMWGLAVGLLVAFRS
jgi:L-lysine exporter family protein LysE/ArgO